MLEHEEQEQQKKLAWLKSAITEGLASGVAEEGSFERVRQHILDRAASAQTQKAPPDDHDPLLRS